LAFFYYASCILLRFCLCTVFLFVFLTRYSALLIRLSSRKCEIELNASVSAHITVPVSIGRLQPTLTIFGKFRVSGLAYSDGKWTAFLPIIRQRRDAIHAADKHDSILWRVSYVMHPAHCRKLDAMTYSRNVIRPANRSLPDEGLRAHPGIGFGAGQTFHFIYPPLLPRFHFLLQSPSFYFFSTSPVPPPLRFPPSPFPLFASMGTGERLNSSGGWICK